MWSTSYLVNTGVIEPLEKSNMQMTIVMREDLLFPYVMLWSAQRSGFMRQWMVLLSLIIDSADLVLTSDSLCSYKGEGIVSGNLEKVWECLKPVPNGLRVKWDNNVKKFELLEQITEVCYFLLVFHVHWVEWTHIISHHVVKLLCASRKQLFSGFSFYVALSKLWAFSKMLLESPPLSPLSRTGHLYLPNSHALSSYGDHISKRLRRCYFSKAIRRWSNFIKWCVKIHSCVLYVLYLSPRWFMFRCTSSVYLLVYVHMTRLLSILYKHLQNTTALCRLSYL